MSKNVAKKRGRPTKYNEKIVNQICALLAQGMSLRTVAVEVEVDLTTIFEWLHKHEEFSQRYARAKQESADAMAEEILEISDDGSNDWMERHDPKNAGYDYNGEHVQRSRLRVDTRKWLMAKMKPKKYGDHIDMTTNGKDLPTPMFGGAAIGAVESVGEGSEA